MIKGLLFTSMLMTSVLAYAQSEKPVRQNDKLDIQKLEQKYWAAKDDEFSVVQNRTYTKAKRFFVTAAAGTPFNDPYSVGQTLGLNLGYYFNERWGVELAYSTSDLEDNEPVKQYTDQGAKPDHNKNDSTLFLTGSFVPFYAKMSVLDKAIIYFDMGINIGIGTNNYLIQTRDFTQKESAPALRIGIFQQIFFSEHFAIRADFNNTWSSQKRKQFTNFDESDPSFRKIGDEVINDSSIMIGITYWH